ncbi:DUF7446 family protein [Pseudomonas typographi]|uniref:Uncharacterized protein n=1 Tax=Pseudomonas typographi TaxID=2715964 RepID=A0ABR7Z9N4_9PSED|nr:hypothetical protein [Pseudomonas typographi]MBD1602276.1 hypothetical protein [Pseudomonas typographi]
MSKRIRLGVTALNGRIIAGFENATGTQITEGSRQDVTSDFMKALIDKAEHHGGTFEIAGAGEKWDVIVKKEPAQ